MFASMGLLPADLLSVKIWPGHSLAMQQLHRAQERSAARRRRTTLHSTNGKRECDRRARQIAAGSLRVENGLVS